MLHVFEARARTQPHTGIHITTRPANTYIHTHTHLLKRAKAHIHTNTGTQTYCTCFYSHRVAHFLWFSHFSLFSRQPTSHVAGSSVCAFASTSASASARDRTSLVASHQPAAGSRPVGSVRTLPMISVGVWSWLPQTSWAVIFLLFDFHFCFATNTFLATFVIVVFVGCRWSITLQLPRCGCARSFHNCP